jgi:hypothetical protein
LFGEAPTVLERNVEIVNVSRSESLAEVAEGLLRGNFGSADSVSRRNVVLQRGGAGKDARQRACAWPRRGSCSNGQG